MAQIGFPQLISLGVDRKLYLLISCDMWIAEKRAAVTTVIDSSRRKEAVLRKHIPLHSLHKSLLTWCLEDSGRSNVPHQFQQVTGQKSNVSRHDQFACGVALQNCFPSDLKLLLIDRLVNEQRIFL